jgi:hypothetical protein
VRRTLTCQVSPRFVIVATRSPNETALRWVPHVGRGLERFLGIVAALDVFQVPDSTPGVCFRLQRRQLYAKELATVAGGIGDASGAICPRCGYKWELFDRKALILKGLI